MFKGDLEIRPGDRVLYGTTLPGLSGGCCRRFNKTVERVDEENDKVFFTDGTSYHHEEDAEMTLELLDDKRPVVIIP